MKIIVVTALLSLLSGCTHLAQQANQPSQNLENPHILQVIKNINVLPETSLGNQATLIKEAEGFCQIEFTGLYQMGEVTENWAFKGNELISASTTKTIYAKPFSTENFSSQNTPITTVQSAPFDVTEPDKIQNFTKLKSYFQKTLLEQCHK